MATLKDNVRLLIESSWTLKQDSSEQWFWLAMLDGLSEEKLQKLQTVLEKEAIKESEILAAHAKKIAAINDQHINELQDFKRVKIPQFLKKWETQDAAQSNPEDILTAID